MVVQFFVCSIDVIMITALINVLARLETHKFQGNECGITKPSWEVRLLGFELSPVFRFIRLMYGKYYLVRNGE